MTYEELVKAIGPGFHPDSLDYASLPEGLTEDDVNRIISEAFAESNALLAPDPYTRAIGVFVENGWW